MMVEKKIPIALLIQIIDYYLLIRWMDGVELRFVNYMLYIPGSGIQHILLRERYIYYYSVPTYVAFVIIVSYPTNSNIVGCTHGMQPPLTKHKIANLRSYSSQHSSWLYNII